jgi:hypothetical protein
LGELKSKAAHRAIGAVGQSDLALILPGGKRAVVEVKYRKIEEGGKIAKILDQALKTIVEKDYAGPFRLAASEVIGLGLAVHGLGQLKAGFVEPEALRPQPAAGVEDGKRDRESGPFSTYQPPLSLRRATALTFFFAIDGEDRSAAAIGRPKASPMATRDPANEVIARAWRRLSTRRAGRVSSSASSVEEKSLRGFAPLQTWRARTEDEGDEQESPGLPALRPVPPPVGDHAPIGR